MFFFNFYYASCFVIGYFAYCAYLPAMCHVNDAAERRKRIVEKLLNFIGQHES